MDSFLVYRFHCVDDPTPRCIIENSPSVNEPLGENETDIDYSVYKLYKRDAPHDYYVGITRMDIGARLSTHSSHSKTQPTRKLYQHLTPEDFEQNRVVCEIIATNMSERQARDYEKSIIGPLNSRSKRSPSEEKQADRENSKKKYYKMKNERPERYKQLLQNRRLYKQKKRAQARESLRMTA